jgi:hypothetical protein
MHVKTGLLLIAWAIAAAASGWRGEVPAQRSYMYVGGQYILNGAGQHVFADQMYVEKLTPAAGVTKPYPIVFIHGQAQTGTVRISEESFSPVPEVNRDAGRIGSTSLTEEKAGPLTFSLKDMHAILSTKPSAAAVPGSLAMGR